MQCGAFYAKFSCMPAIARYEETAGFDPVSAVARKRVLPRFVRLSGTESTTPPVMTPSAEEVLSSSTAVNPHDLPLRDPGSFVARQLGNHLDEWELLLQHCDSATADMVRNWLSHGIDLQLFLKPFKGKFRGISYDMALPHSYYQANAATCQSDPNVVARTLEERLKNGSMQLLGRWDNVPMDQLPDCIMPLTLDSKKTRVCHDERFLNLFVKDSPFKLDTLRDVPRIVPTGSLLINTDEKSGYDHIALAQESKRFFGLMYDGWVMCYTTLPFGFKAACFIYQTVGGVVSSYLRGLGIPLLQYIDDRLIVVSNSKGKVPTSTYLYATLQLLSRLGYTLSLSKCCLIPSTKVRFLGFIVDAEQRTFSLPEDKRMDFCELLACVLRCKELDLQVLQKLAGKCSSMSIAIPGAMFYVREINNAVSLAQRSGKPVPLAGPLLDELLHWRFMETWSGVSTWKNERHLAVQLATDASSFKWAGKLLSGNAVDTDISDYFRPGDERPIHIKEAEALIKTLLSLRDTIAHHRVDILTDSMALIGAWNRQGSRNTPFNACMKELFVITVDLDLDLQLKYINTKVNPADAPSRQLNKQDARLAGSHWRLLDDMFGPHSCDLMALDSNVMLTKEGTALKHFTPHPTPESAGVNVFSQDIQKEVNPYVFPPLSMISPVLSFLEETKVKKCTVVVPSRANKDQWWPKIEHFALKRFRIASKGETAVLWYPSKLGWSLDTMGLPWDLYAFRLSFD